MKHLYAFLMFVLLPTLTFGLPLTLDEGAKTKLSGAAEAREELVQEKSLENLKTTEKQAEAITLEEEKSPLLGFQPLVLLREKEPQLFRNLKVDDLELFGAELFNRINLELSRIPVHQRRVPNDYPIGVGDELMVHAWNETQDQNVKVEVGVNGSIQFPLAGEIPVAGIEYSNLRSHLLKSLSKFYKGLQITIDLVKLRRFPIYVTGESKVPGVYIGTALSTPLQLLIATGGPTARGSLRSISLMRDTKKVKEIDLYSFLMSGSLDQKFFLGADDVLHIPVAHKKVAIVGRVKRAGIYELKKGEGFREIIRFAGGFEADAVQSNIQLVQFDRLGRPGIQDLDYKYSNNTEIADGAIILVHPSQTLLGNKVSLEGSVVNPGVYQWRKGLTVAEAIKRAQGLQPGTFLGRAEIQRHLTTPEDFVVNDGVKSFSNKQIIGVSLESELSGKIKTLMKQGDLLTVFQIDEIQDLPQVEVIGTVNKKGLYPLQKDSRIRDVLFQAQLNRQSHMLRGEVHRQVQAGVEILKFNVTKAIEGDPKENLLLLDGDVITIFENPDRRSLGRITLKGQVKFPGVYPFKPGERLLDVVKRAGGVTERGYLFASKFFRESVRMRQLKARDQFVRKQKEELARLEIGIASNSEGSDEKEEGQRGLKEISEAIDKLSEADIDGRIDLDFRGILKLEDLINSVSNIELEDKDVFEVPVRPTEIYVVGHVYSPTTVVWAPGNGVQDYINLAGGMTESAYPSKVYVLKADGRAVPAVQIKRKRKRGLFVSSVRGKNKHSGHAIDIGDTIVVPARIRLGKDRFKETLDSVYKMAVSVGALGGLFK